ncbi:MAG: hypothetical protein CMH60_03470 [Myxococcales bacterium]|nr:hypothetical protein [Myxococcales bacterium]
MPDIVVAALYKFCALDNYAQVRDQFEDLCLAKDIKGTLIFSDEGVNGTVAGSRNAINELRSALAKESRFDGMEYKESYCEEQPFLRLKVKTKNEIVTMGVLGAKPAEQTGQHVAAKDWNALLKRKDLLLLDTRNTYETRIGVFEGAVDPGLSDFREFPQYVDENLDPEKTPAVAMYCTGGIRCEKASAYMLAKGFKEVFQLNGGILRYLEEVDAEESTWQGDCFVFDNRVSVDQDLRQGDYSVCYSCREPLREEDKLSEHYELGVSCHYCYESHSEERKARLRERQKQVELAKSRKETHIGADMTELRRKNR